MATMKSVFVITMWSGGRPAKKWKSYEQPEPLSQGTGVTFVSIDTKLPVSVIGNISVEEFESGKEEFEDKIAPNAGAEGEEAEPSTTNVKRLF